MKKRDLQRVIDRQEQQLNTLHADCNDLQLAIQKALPAVKNRRSGAARKILEDALDKVDARHTRAKSES